MLQVTLSLAMVYVYLRSARNEYFSMTANYFVIRRYKLCMIYLTTNISSKNNIRYNWVSYQQDLNTQKVQWFIFNQAASF